MHASNFILLLSLSLLSCVLCMCVHGFVCVVVHMGVETQDWCWQSSWISNPELAGGCCQSCQPSCSGSPWVCILTLELQAATMPTWNLCGSLHRQHLDTAPSLQPQPSQLFNCWSVFTPLLCYMNLRVAVPTCAKKSFQGLDLDFTGWSVWEGLVYNIYDFFISCWVSQVDLELLDSMIPCLSLWSNQASGRHPILSNLLISEHGLALILFRSASISFINIP